MATIGFTQVDHLGLAVWLRSLANETAKGLRIMWAHKVTLVLQLAHMAVTYLLFQAVLGGGGPLPALLPVTLLAYLVNLAGYVCLLKAAAGLLEEVNTGTLEQSHLGPLPHWALSRCSGGCSPTSRPARSSRSTSVRCQRG